MAAPLKKLHSPSDAVDILTVLDKGQAVGSGKKRHDTYHLIECNIAYARIYVDQEYYPIATTLLQDTLDLMQQAKTGVHTLNIRAIYDTIKASPYGKSEELAQPGVSLVKTEYAQIF